MVFILIFVHYSDTMRHYCIVPLCNNRSGTPEAAGLSFYRLPLKDPALLKLWLVRIQRENTPVNQHSRVYSAHFEGGRKVGKKDIPSVFAWTKKASCPPPKEHTTNVTSQGSCLLEEDAQPTEDLSCNQETVDLEGMVMKSCLYLLGLKCPICH